VPSIGYKSYRAISAGALEQHSTLKATENEIENEFFKIEIDPSTGCISSIFDKRLDRQILDKDGQGNLIQIIQDFGDSEGFLNSPQGEPEYNFWTGKYWNVDSEPEIEIVESGPVSVVVQVKKKFELARFTQRIKIYA
ncbi:MAG: hypothetical protein GXO76_01985, partial [Calditrichaeota bacterium]|nr:hypothetical protein [Calditrichota bacterium]